MNDPNINDNFVAVFPASHMNIYILTTSLWYLKKRQISFHHSKYRELWQGRHVLVEYIRIEPSADLFIFLFIYLIIFDTFGVGDLKSFIIQDDKKSIEKILFGTEQLTRTDNKITLVNIKISLNACKHLSKNELVIFLHCSVFWK